LTGINSTLQTIISVWNSLEDSVVSADTVDAYKNHLGFGYVRKLSTNGEQMFASEVVM